MTPKPAIPQGLLTTRQAAEWMGISARKFVTLGLRQVRVGRWPANVVCDEDAARELDAQSGVLKAGVAVNRNRDGSDDRNPNGHCYGTFRNTPGPDVTYGDSGGASRFFFTSREPNATAPNDPLILRRAEAILWAWNPELASTADDVSSLSSEHAASALSRAVTAASHAATQLSGLTGLSTSVTPKELSALCLNAIALTLSFGGASSPERRHERLSQSSSHASNAGTREPTDITTTMIGHSTSAGSAVVATLAATLPNSAHGDQDLAGSRFRYCAKASREEREQGLRGFALHDKADQSAWTAVCRACGCAFVLNGKPTCGHDDVEWKPTRPARNHHPTVKPLDLMRWLVRLVTPPNGVVLDPFCGSGTTGCAAVMEGRAFIGIEREPEYVEIARARIAHWSAQYQPSLFGAA